MIDKLPFLLIDSQKCNANIAFMAEKARKANLFFRPHFKTHQSHAVGEFFRNHGVSGITVSSPGMAEYFTHAGWNDITIAFPFVPQWSDKANQLARQVTLNILFSSPANLVAAIDKISSEVGVFIEIDVGHGRSGLLPDRTRELAVMLNLLESNSKLKFKGFLTHAGHSYSAKSRDEVMAIHAKSVTQLIKLKSFWKERYPDLIVSYGDTPTCSVADDFWGIDEIRPGNFVFYDVMQSQIGSCDLSQIALALICPVVDVLHDQKKILVHGGAVHLSKEKVTKEGADCYGLVCHFDGEAWGQPLPGAYVGSLSQEHGMIYFSNEVPTNIRTGDLLAILPVHSCLTVDCMAGAYDSKGNYFDVLPKK